MEKEFKTITLRNLDLSENKDIVQIMNSVGEATGLKTGQSIIEHIIRDYQKVNNRFQNYINSSNEKHGGLRKEIVQLKQTISTQNNCLIHLQKGFKLLSELE